MRFRREGDMNFNFLFLIFFSAFLSVTGQSCKLSSEETGYCREGGDCFGFSQSSGCDNGLVCCQNHEKSLKKCVDYGAYVYRKVYSEALTVKSLIRNTSDCVTDAIPLIVGGLKAKQKEFPHMAGIGYGDDIKTAIWLCGGSLISENFVLTAAHCSKSEKWGPAKYVRVGAINLRNPESSKHQDFFIVEIINHPNYKPPSLYNDIALFKLSDSIAINGFARPACLHTSPNELELKTATATGWGKIHYDAEDQSEELMKVVLNFIDHHKCNSFFLSDRGGRSLAKGIISSQLCAGELLGGKDTCQGDSGGPLQIDNDHYCMYSIVGITSFGRFCGFKNSPSIYTRVSYFVPWIESVVWS